jgi:hypothetical protein
VSMLQEDEVHFWISNITDLDLTLGRKPEMSGFEGAIMVSPQKMRGELTAFIKFHANEIEVLKSVYDEVTVKWGLIGYWN